MPEDTDVRHMQAALMRLVHGTYTALIILGSEVEALAVDNHPLACSVLHK